MILFQQIPTDVVRHIFEEWCGVVEFAHLQVTLTIAPQFLERFLGRGWKHLRRDTRQCILNRLATSDRYADLLCVLREIPMRDHNIVSSRWLGSWMIDSWRLYDRMHIALDVIWEDAMRRDDTDPPEWLTHHAHTLRIVHHIPLRPLPRTIRAVWFEHGDGPTDLWPHVEELSLVKLFRANASPRLANHLWPSVHTLRIDWTVVIGTPLISLQYFPVLRHLILQGLGLVQIIAWKQAPLLERIEYYTRTSYPSGIFDPPIAPPPCLMPALREIRLTPCKPNWATFAMTTQAPFLETLEVWHHDFPQNHDPCPRLTTLHLKFDDPRMTSPPPLSASLFPALCNVVTNLFRSDRHEWMQSLPASVVRVEYQYYVFVRTNGEWLDAQVTASAVPT